MPRSLFKQTKKLRRRRVPILEGTLRPRQPALAVATSGLIEELGESQQNSGEALGGSGAEAPHGLPRGGALPAATVRRRAEVPQSG